MCSRNCYNTLITRHINIKLLYKIRTFFNIFLRLLPKMLDAQFQDKSSALKI